MAKPGERVRDAANSARSIVPSWFVSNASNARSMTSPAATCCCAWPGYAASCVDCFVSDDRWASNTPPSAATWDCSEESMLPMSEVALMAVAVYARRSGRGLVVRRCKMPNAFVNPFIHSYKPF